MQGLLCRVRVAQPGLDGQITPANTLPLMQKLPSFRITSNSTALFCEEPTCNNSLLQEALSGVPAALRHAPRDQPGTLRVERVLSGLHALMIVHLSWFEGQ